jgi:hypothetical protein
MGLPDNLSDDFMRIGAQHIQDAQKLQNVQPPLAAFKIRYKRLGLTQRAR